MVRGSVLDTLANSRSSMTIDRSGKIVIQLNGHLNRTGVISPRFNIQHSQIESWVNLLLPARSFGHLILTTSSRILDHEEARRKAIGGKLLGYVY